MCIWRKGKQAIINFTTFGKDTVERHQSEKHFAFKPSSLLNNMYRPRISLGVA